MNNIIPNYTDLSFKFINSNSKLNSLKLLKTFNLLLEKREQDIINQCFDFSFLSPSSKSNLNTYLNSKNTALNNAYTEPVYDNFLTLIKLFKRKNSPNIKVSKKFDKFNNDEVYTYSISKTRELLYLYSNYCKLRNSLHPQQKNIFSKPNIHVVFENIDIYNKCYNLQNINQVVNSLNIEHIIIKP